MLKQTHYGHVFSSIFGIIWDTTYSLPSFLIACVVLINLAGLLVLGHGVLCFLGVFFDRAAVNGGSMQRQLELGKQVIHSSFCLLHLVS